MDRDEVYRRALKAAFAVTGGRLARVSLGICIAGSGLGCIEDHSFDTISQPDSALTEGPDGSRGVDSRAEHTEPPEPTPDAADQPAPDDQTISDLEPDTGLADLDMGVGEQHVQGDASDDHPNQHDAAEEHPDTDVPVLAEDTCLSEDGSLTDWRCCDAHGWDQNIQGCTPCDFRSDPAEWSECVTCSGLNRNESPQDLEEYMACCDAVHFNFEMGCLAWGPPAPPRFDGRTLEELLGQ